MGVNGYFQGRNIVLLLVTLVVCGCQSLPSDVNPNTHTPTIIESPVASPPSNLLSEADTRFTNGHYLEAFHDYSRLDNQYPDSADIVLRLGISLTIRGEYALAEAKLRRALWLGLENRQHDLALLYTSVCLREQHLPLEALRVWDRASENSSLIGIEHILRGEWEVRQGHALSATAEYRAATAYPLPSDWLPLVAYRLALFDAAGSPDTSRANLAEFFARYAPWSETDGPFSYHLFAMTTPPNPFLSPLIPNGAGDVGQFLAILNTTEPERFQLLGQWYLDRQLYGLAQIQFEQAIADTPQGVLAAAYGAYARWRAGNGDEEIDRLKQIADEHPETMQARLLLTLIYMEQDDHYAVRRQMRLLDRTHPQSPDVSLLQAKWYVRQSDYASASEAYQNALQHAPDSRRGRLALLAAQFYLETSYRVCDIGEPSAEYAARRLPNDSPAWTTLAAVRYACRDFAGSVTAARRAVEHEGGAGAVYYLGAALAEQGSEDEARELLVQAADSDPDSVWRVRAEEKLARLGASPQFK